MNTDLLSKCHEFICAVDVRGDWWEAQRAALADELEAAIRARDVERDELLTPND